MQTKILFTDLDGTLLNDEKKVSSALFGALHQLQVRGHILVLSSGRPLDSIIEVKEMLHLQNRGLYISAYNGGLIYDCSTKQSIIEKRVSFADAAYILEVARHTHTYCHTYTATHIVTEEESKELAHYLENIHLPVICTPRIMEYLTEEPFKLLAIDTADHAHLEQFKEALQPWANGRITTLFSNQKYLELIPATAGKGQALAELCQHLQIPVSNAMSAGDMDNDISMIEVAGFSVAMQNATPLVKEKATIISEYDNNHDGLLPYIKEFFALL